MTEKLSRRRMSSNEYKSRRAHEEECRRLDHEVAVYGSRRLTKEEFAAKHGARLKGVVKALDLKPWFEARRTPRPAQP